MTTQHHSEPTEHDDDTAAKKKRPETLADFMALDTVVGAVSSQEDGYDGPPLSMDTGRQFTEMLWEKHQREQEKARRRKEQGRR